MTNHEQERFAALEAAIDAFTAQPVSAGPPDDLVTSTVEALQERENSAVPAVARRTRRETMIRVAKYSTLGTAASICALAVGSLFIGGIAGQSAFAQVVKNVSEAKSAAYSLIQKIGDQPALSCESAFSDRFIRTEVAGQFVHIVDVQSRESLQLVPTQQLAFRGIVDGDKQPVPPSIVDVMKEMTVDHGTFVQSVVEDGKKRHLYRVSQIPSFMGAGKLDDEGMFHVWVDPETHLPTRIKLRIKIGPQDTPVEMDFDNFRWNPEFPPGFFSMAVPEGYQLMSTPPGDEAK